MPELPHIILAATCACKGVGRFLNDLANTIANPIAIRASGVQIMVTMCRECVCNIYASLEIHSLLEKCQHAKGWLQCKSYLFTMYSCWHGHLCACAVIS